MHKVKFSDRPIASGKVRITHICRDKNGNPVPIQDAIADKELAKRIVKEQDNLVVNSGRAVMVRALGGLYQSASQSVPYIDRIILGDGSKSGNTPNLSDTSLVREIKNSAGTNAGTFLLNSPSDPSPEVTFPASVSKVSNQGPATISINSDGETRLVDAGADFVTDSIQLADQVTLANSVTNPLVLGIRNIISATELELYNPTGYTGAVNYSIGTAGNQMLVSKLFLGNDFPIATYPTSILITEAGLLYNNGTLFNRVLFAPQIEEGGILIQSDETNGVEISARIEWLVTL